MLDPEAKESTALARLHEASSRLWHKHDLREGLDEMLAGAIDLLGAEMGNIQILDPARGVLEIAAQRGFGQDFLDSFREVSAADDTACGRALRSGERVLIADVEADAPYAPFRPAARAAGYRAVQSTPVIGRSGAPLGILSTHFRSVHRPAERDLRLLDLYVRQAADFIERCRTDDVLRDSEARLRLAQQAAKIGTFEWNLQTGVNIWTPEMEALHGLAPGEFGKTQLAWEQLVHPEDRGAASGWVKQAFETGKTLEREWRIVWPDGSVHWICGRFQLFRDDAGQPLRLTGVNIDITERKRIEEELRASEGRFREMSERLSVILAAAPIGISYTESGSFERIIGNPAMMAQFEVPAGTGAPGSLPAAGSQKYRFFCRGREIKLEDLPWHKAFAENAVTRPLELEVENPSGKSWLCEAITAPVRDETGKPIGAISVTSDITARKQSERQLQLLMREVNHRAKNLLAVVQSVANQTAKKGDFGEFAGTLQQRLASLAACQDLLVANEWKGVDLASLVHSQLSHFEGLMDGRITFEGPPARIGPSAAQTISMALHELGTNAAKYGALSNDKGSVRVEWNISDGFAPRFHLKWTEVGGPPSAPPARRGFGSKVLTEMAELALDADIVLEYPSSGQIWELTAPADQILDPALSCLGELR